MGGFFSHLLHVLQLEAGISLASFHIHVLTKPCPGFAPSRSSYQRSIYESDQCGMSGGAQLFIVQRRREKPLEKFDLLEDIAQRTDGDIYLGIVGPVRTGKSTFIKRFMDLMVLPNIKDENDRERTKDALPQSGAGRTIMTTEPKFIPDERSKLYRQYQLARAHGRLRRLRCARSFGVY